MNDYYTSLTKWRYSRPCKTLNFKQNGDGLYILNVSKSNWTRQHCSFIIWKVRDTFRRTGLNMAVSVSGTNFANEGSWNILRVNAVERIFLLKNAIMIKLPNLIPTPSIRKPHTYWQTLNRFVYKYLTEFTCIFISPIRRSIRNRDRFLSEPFSRGMYGRCKM